MRTEGNEQEANPVIEIREPSGARVGHPVLPLPSQRRPIIRLLFRRGERLPAGRVLHQRTTSADFEEGAPHGGGRLQSHHPGNMRGTRLHT